MPALSDLDQRIELQQLTEVTPATRNKYGEAIPPVTTYARCWAQVLNSGGTEDYKEKGNKHPMIFPNASHKVTIRWRDVHPTHWVKWRGRILNIEGTEDAGDFLVLHCKESL